MSVQKNKIHDERITQTTDDQIKDNDEFKPYIVKGERGIVVSPMRSVIEAGLHPDTRHNMRGNRTSQFIRRDEGCSQVDGNRRHSTAVLV